MIRSRPYPELARAWRELRSVGVRIREVACVGAPRTLLLGELGDTHGAMVSISAGVHGDEPAAPWALVSLVRDGLLDRRFAYRLWPCLNPSGYEAGTRGNAEGDDVNRSFSGGGTTPESRAVIASNRDRRFRLALDLHEDFEADGCYVYEPLGKDAAPRYAHAVIAAVQDAGLPVQRFAAGFDLGVPHAPAPPYRLEPGAVLVDAERELRLFTGLPQSLFHYRRGSAALTIESPRPRAWEERIATHRVAVTTALAHLPT